MNLRDWLAERQQNAEHLAKLRPQDREGWLEDANYFRSALQAVDELERRKRARVPQIPADLAGAIAYQLTKRLVIDMPTARAVVDAATGASGVDLPDGGDR